MPGVVKVIYEVFFADRRSLQGVPYTHQRRVGWRRATYGSYARVSKDQEHPEIGSNYANTKLTTLAWNNEIGRRHGTRSGRRVSVYKRADFALTER
ncbi:hypothetical protein VTK56DRAFT_8117 [Thermocarpiscus australiensis]